MSVTCVIEGCELYGRFRAYVLELNKRMPCASISSSNQEGDKPTGIVSQDRECPQRNMLIGIPRTDRY